jgi:hypothetical protein
MKNNDDEEEDDLLPEYDFSQMAGGVRGKYAAACRQGTNRTNLARLVPDAPGLVEYPSEGP